MKPAPYEVLRKEKTVTSVGFATTIVLGVTSAWLYVAGWAYAYNFFDHFRIPLLTLQIPKEYFLLYGGFVVRHFPLWAIAFAAVLVTVTVFWPRFRIDAGRLRVLLAMLALAAAFWFALDAGRIAADWQFDADRTQDFRAYYRVQVFPRNTVSRAPGSPWESEDLQNGCYRLILDNRDRLFLVRPVNVPAADLPLVELPWAQVETMLAVPGDARCP
jgi:hypothetical protein